MLSDESSSDSETGRFKCRTKSQDEKSKSNIKEDRFRPSARSRPSDNDRFRRELQRPSRDDKDRYARHPRDSNRFSRISPPRRHSRERSSSRRSHERHRHDRDSRGGAKPRRRSNSRERKKSISRERKKSISRERKKSISRERKRSNSKERKRSRSKDNTRDKGRDSRPRSHISPRPRSPERRRDFKEEIKRNIIPIEKSEEKPSTRDKDSLSPDHQGKRSEVYIPPPTETKKTKIESPIILEEHSDASEEVQPGSYYSMIPAVIKDKSEESSEIDSSDDEKLRAKLLNLEKELHKTKKKKHKKKHKKKQSRSKDREQDTPTVAEVTSTTDIQDNVKNDDNNLPDVVEVTSTQKNSQKESGEEGEIISDDDSQSQYEIDPTDLRHKLKRSLLKTEAKTDVCGPVLPPHLEKQYTRSKSPLIEGPVLPPHLKKKSRHIGPSIPDDMRKVLSEKVSKYESSDDDDGIGPLPAGAEEKWSEAHQQLEERALDMKIRKLDGHSLHKSDVKSREEWMLKLPEGKAKYLGLEARSFRAKAGPDMSDRSSWTDTPEEKERKAAGIQKEEDMEAALRRDARARQIANRDDEQEDAIKKHKKKHKREESLLELHERKLKKKKKKEEKDEGKKERRPFSRDVDLQVNRFDEAQKKSIIKKAQALDTRFSRGEAKYL